MTARASRFASGALGLVTAAAAMWALGPARAEPAGGWSVPDTVIASLAAGDYGVAVEALTKIVEAEPQNGVAWYFLGKAYNRLALHAMAEEPLYRAAVLGFATPDLRREMGISLVGQGREGEALPHLNAADADDTLAAYFRGLAALSLKDIGQAREALNTAKTDPKLADRAQRLLAELDSGRIRAPGDWEYRLDLGTAYVDNVSLTPDQAIQVPGQRADRSAPALSVRWSGRRESPRRGRTRFTTLFSAAETVYFGLSDFNTTDLSVGLEIAPQRGPNWGRIQPTIQQTFVGASGYRTSLVVPWTLSWPVSPSSTLETNYAARFDDYHFTAIPPEDLDGFSQHLDLAVLTKLNGGKCHGRFALTYDRNHADGASVRYRAVGVQVDLARPLSDGLQLDLTYVYRAPKYTGPNVRDAAFPQRRRDDLTNVWRVGLSRQLSAGDSVALEYFRISNHSNLPAFYAYKQEQVGLRYQRSY